MVKLIKEILTNLYQRCQIIRFYLTFLYEVNINEIDNAEDLQSKFNEIMGEEKDCPMELAETIYINYLKLVNMIFDESAQSQPSDFIDELMEERQIVQILKNLELNLEIRKEILKFYRVVKIDVSIAADKLVEYRKNICVINPPANDLVVVGGSERGNIFLENLILISNDAYAQNVNHGESNEEEGQVEELSDDDENSLEDAEDDEDNISEEEEDNANYFEKITENKPKSKEFEIIDNELKNFQEIIENNPNMNPEILLDYMENGIIVPLKIYLSKMFFGVLKMSGSEFLEIYEMAYHLLNNLILKRSDLL